MPLRMKLQFELRFLSRICIFLLQVYRKYFDDGKGFKCAYKAVYGGHSCTDVMLNGLRKYPFLKAVVLCKEQLDACEAAALIAPKCQHLHFDGQYTRIAVGTALFLVAACNGDSKPPKPTLID